MSDQYNEMFYLEQNERSYTSARITLSLFRDFFPVSTLVDVGCGLGSWARAALDIGFPDVLGIDGEFVDTKLLVIPKQKFKRQDLSKSFDIERRFDVAIAMEVAEHIDACDADTFVNNLCNLSNLILFSAAVPGQGGVHHVNEQPQSYWIEKFHSAGYQCSLELRDRLWNEDSICGYYRQNMLVFHRVQAGQQTILNDGITDVIHPAVFAGEKIHQAHVRSSVRQLMKLFISSIVSKIKN